MTDTTASGEQIERRCRYQPKAMYEMAEQLRRQGVDFVRSSGPWRAVARALSRPGRARQAVLPIVTNGVTQVMVDTLEHARDVAGLLNWSGVDELNPVADLVPPPGLALEHA
jgi:hypothetical protein